MLTSASIFPVSVRAIPANGNPGHMSWKEELHVSCDGCVTELADQV